MKSVLDMLNDAAEREGRSSHPKLDHEVVIHRLREVAERYARPNPFKIGDLVTPYPDSSARSAGEPRIVIDVREAEYDFKTGISGQSAYGFKSDIRVLAFSNDSFFSLWFDSACYDFWKAPEKP